MQNQEQFDKILDEALELQKSGKSVADILVLFPQHAAELKDLLETKAQLEKITPNDETKAAFARMLESLPSVIPSVVEKSRNSFFTSIFILMKSLSTMRLAGAALVVLAAVGLSANLRQSISTSGPAIKMQSASVSSGFSPASSGGGGGNGSIGAFSLEAPHTNIVEKEIKASGAAEMGQAIGMSAPSRGMMDEASIGYAPYPPDIMPIRPEPDYPGIPPITDNREFLKTDYNSTIKTRHVAEMGNRIQTLVRGYGGRIDGASFNEKFGYLSFVVPQNQFMLFKSELTSIVGKRFIVESVSVQNMLPQKQGIEQQAKSASSTLMELKESRSAMVKKYNAIIGSLRAGIARETAAITALDKEAATTTDQNRLAEIKKERAAHVSTRSGLQTRLANETNNYEYELASIDSQIKGAEGQIENLKVQDKNLIDDVATVRGTIAIEWVSIMEIVNLYTIEGWPWIVLALGAALVIISYRRRHPPTAVSV
jgi:hypothetical protein